MLLKNGKSTPFELADFGLETTVACLAGERKRLGEVIINPGQVRAVGYGSGDPMTAQGRIYCDLQDATDAQLPGRVIFVAETYSNNYIEEIFQETVEYLSVSKTQPKDQRKCTLVDEGRLIELHPYEKLVMYFEANADCTITTAKSSLYMAGTEWITR